MTIRSILACLALLPLLASCVMQGDVDSLNARMNRNEQQMQQLSSQVGNVEQVLPGQAEMWAQMQAMRQELNMVRGQMDEMTAGSGPGGMGQLSAHVGRLDAAVRLMASQLGVQVDVLNAPAEGDPNAVPPAGTDGLAPVAPGTTVPVVSTPPAATVPQTAEQKDTATHLYDSGMSAFASSNFKGALRAFTDFTKTFPTHNLASNAHFWRGESYYQLKDYAGAALAYQDVIQKFPGSGKVQSALLKQGMALYYLDQKDVAKASLNDLIKKYPSSPEAGRAKKFLEQNK